jgi:hypothetical protein
LQAEYAGERLSNQKQRLLPKDAAALLADVNVLVFCIENTECQEQYQSAHE